MGGIYRPLVWPAISVTGAALLRRARASERRVVYAILASLFFGLFLRAVDGREAWVAAALGACLIPVLTELTGYYLSALLIAGFLRLTSRAIGPLLAAAAALSCLV